MNGLRSKLPDILLYPEKLFEKISDRKATLYAGIVLIGAIDLLPDIAGMFKQLFSGKPVYAVYFNAVTVLMIAVLGLIDVIFISVPGFLTVA